LRHRKESSTVTDAANKIGNFLHRICGAIRYCFSWPLFFALLYLFVIMLACAIFSVLGCFALRHRLFLLAH
jgi:hypothetical protein